MSGYSTNEVLHDVEYRARSLVQVVQSNLTELFASQDMF